MYILGREAILTGWPWYHCGLNFSSFLRVKNAFLLGSYILLSIIPWDSGYSPCNWEYALLQCSEEKEPSSYSSLFFRQIHPLNSHSISDFYSISSSGSKFSSIISHCFQALLSNPYLLLSEIFKKLGTILWDQTERHRLSSNICCIFSTKDKAITYARPPSHEQKL